MTKSTWSIISDYRVFYREIAMLLSKSCMYAVRAAILITSKNSNGEGKFVPVRVLADELEISFHFLTKILQKLGEANLIESFRGPNGGVRLARSAKDVSLLDIITAIDGPGAFQNCVLGLPGCGVEKPCPLHERWTKQRERLKSMFSRANLLSLQKKVSQSDFRA